MYNYCLYNEIGKEYKEDAKFLLEKYDFQLINPDNDLAKKDIERIKNIKHDNISHFFIDKTGKKHYIFRDKMSNNDILENLNKNKALHDIDRIYYYCYGKAYNHTFYNISTRYMESRLNIKKKFNKMYPLYEKLANVENLIQEHCLITSLYTVQYLLNKHEQFTAKQLSDIENMGHDYFVTSKKSKDLLIENKEIYNKILPVLKEIDGMVCNGEVSNSYLGQAFAAIYQNKYIKYSVPQFLCNYSYSIIRMYQEFPLNQLLNEIDKEHDNPNKNKKMKNFLMEYSNHCNYFMTDKEKSTDIDKILFHYQKENTFNYQLISKLFFKDSGENEKNAYLLQELFTKSCKLKMHSITTTFSIMLQEQFTD